MRKYSLGGGNRVLVKKHEKLGSGPYSVTLYVGEFRQVPLVQSLFYITDFIGLNEKRQVLRRVFVP